ncbi:hypothetical protein HPB48_012406 [Haemaphysalis longicornis]|uniref:Peptidase S1 domain-containing protein n=1 Tax=Haemaphysalis longicornis TaxID=44386 RepID=A0A9J6G1L6_HAELO|nr:hypothetical protein HPB48_012406 [Haemaphysalis longicornis]
MVHTWSRSQGKRAPKLTVLYGHATLALARRVSVTRTTLHPDYYDRTLKNDIALIELSRDLAFSENVQPVCLPDHDFPPLPTYTGIVAGWGYTADRCDVICIDDVSKRGNVVESVCKGKKG